MKKLIAILLTLLFVVAGCADDGAQTTETTDTAAAEEKKDFATRVGDTVGTATANADQMRQDENQRVDEVNQAMDE